MISRAKQLCETDSMIDILIDLTRGVDTNISSCMPNSVIKYTNKEASERERLPRDTHDFDGINDNYTDTRLYFS